MPAVARCGALTSLPSGSGAGVWQLVGLVFAIYTPLTASLAALEKLRAANGENLAGAQSPEVPASPAERIAAFLHVGRGTCFAALGWLAATRPLPWSGSLTSAGPLGELPWQGAASLAALALVLWLCTVFATELGQRWPAAWLRACAWPLAAGAGVVRPFLALQGWGARQLRRLLPSSTFDGDALKDEEDLRRMVASSAEQSQLSEQKREMLDNIFELSERVARQVMVPRADVVSLDVNQDIERNLQLARETGHTRFPLCDGDLDNLLGFIHIKDLFRRGSNPTDLRSMKRETFFVPETVPLEKLMRQMRVTHVHMAPIVDEYGSVSGIVTFENVLEEIVGEIQDEFDAERPELVRSSDGTFQVLGSMLIADLEDQLAVHLDNDEDDTIGGVALSAIGRSPEVGDRIQVGPLSLEVLEVDVNRIRSLRLRRTEPAEPFSAVS